MAWVLGRNEIENIESIIEGKRKTDSRCVDLRCLWDIQMELVCRHSWIWSSAKNFELDIYIIFLRRDG